jgi:hypothetical protein
MAAGLSDYVWSYDEIAALANWDMHKVLMTGHAETPSGAFDFKVGNWAGGIGLKVRHASAGDKAFNGAGIWPTIGKAKQIADQTVTRKYSRIHHCLIRCLLSKPS